MEDYYNCYWTVFSFIYKALTREDYFKFFDKINLLNKLELIWCLFF